MKRIPYEKAKDEDVNYWIRYTGRRNYKEIDNTAHSRLLQLGEEGLGSLLWCFDKNGELGENYSSHTLDRLKTTYIIGQKILGKGINKIIEEASKSKVKLTNQWVKDFCKIIKEGKYKIIKSETGPLVLDGILKDGLSINVLKFQSEENPNYLLYWGGEENKLKNLVEETYKSTHKPTELIVGLPRRI
ncbi:hypothetical protein HYU23_04235 [Candidatus Woesearchaeota archaeon]|nr:hypothetical protein [Candidatus Woesearchaeota archaeon]